MNTTDNVTDIQPTIEVLIPGVLWDSIVEPLGQDVPRIGRWDGIWTYQKVGYGGRYRTLVTREEGEQVWRTLNSYAGLMGQTWAADAESRSGMRAESNAAYRAANRLAKALDR